MQAPQQRGNGEATGSAPFGSRLYSREEEETLGNVLQQKLGKKYLSSRPGAGGSNFTYLESWKAIELANTILGFNKWSCSIVELKDEYVEFNGARNRYEVGMTAIVRVTLQDGSYHEDIGFGSSERPKRGDAIEHAKKEAVTDARKRCLRLFGNATGNSIYDKKHLKSVKCNTTDSNQVLGDSYQDIRAASYSEDKKRKFSESSETNSSHTSTLNGSHSDGYVKTESASSINGYPAPTRQPSGGTTFTSNNRMEQAKRPKLSAVSGQIIPAKVVATRPVQQVGNVASPQQKNISSSAVTSPNYNVQPVKQVNGNAASLKNSRDTTSKGENNKNAAQHSSSPPNAQQYGRESLPVKQNIDRPKLNGTPPLKDYITSGQENERNVQGSGQGSVSKPEPGQVVGANASVGLDNDAFDFLAYEEAMSSMNSAVPSVRSDQPQLTTTPPVVS